MFATSMVLKTLISQRIDKLNTHNHKFISCLEIHAWRRKKNDIFDDEMTVVTVMSSKIFTFEIISYLRTLKAGYKMVQSK